MEIESILFITVAIFVWVLTMVVLYQVLCKRIEKLETEKAELKYELDCTEIHRLSNRRLKSKLADTEMKYQTALAAFLATAGAFLIAIAIIIWVSSNN